MLKTYLPTFKLAAICLAGLLLNIAASTVAEYLELPFYFDTFGTIFIAILGGYVPGIAVGFFTSLISSGFHVENMYYSVISAIVAILSAFLASKGYYEKLSKVLITIPITVLMTTFLGTFIDELIKPLNAFYSLERFQEHFIENFFNEFPDKTLAIVIAFLLLKLIPPNWKEQFYLFGKKQAPLTEEMNNEIKKQSKFISSLQTKLVFIIMAITIFVAVFVSAISYAIYQNSEVNDRIRIADGIISMVVNEINPYRVDEFLELGHKAEGYSEVERNLYKIRASNYDIKFLYVYKVMEDGCHVVFDLETTDTPASQPGSIEDFDESFEPYKEDLLKGYPIEPIINNDTYGYLLTIYKPVYNHEGKCVCYAGIDFSMDMINDYGRTFIVRVVASFSAVVILILVSGLSFIKNSIILPINTMAHCTKNFSYDSEAARENNVEQIQSLAIKTNDEIENLYAAFVKAISDSMHSFENLRKAKIQVAVMEELAHTDSLTGLKNKTSYSEVTTRLDADILKGNANFVIIMIDVNYLKKVNDTYGHERGNEYLINAAKLACSIFGKDHVYRVGGDEFVVIFYGEEVANSEEKISRIRDEIKRLKANSKLEPWEKVSAAVGVAFYQKGVDSTAEDVFKRADADMYKNKLAMKAVRKD